MAEYKGWTLFDKVIIVAKREKRWDFNKRDYVEGELQGYIVDPSNKTMLENAIRWGTFTERTDEKDKNGRWIYKETPPSEYPFDNNGFTLELLDCAEGSSQGGKLSFWNCLITKEEHKFKVGIAANLLLELLKQSTFINGVCQSPVFFARCKGGVGMLHKDMDSYKEALSDMKKKSAVKSGKKTSKWEIGCNYVTLQTDSILLTKAYRWLEPMYANVNWRYDKFIGYKKLEKPVPVYIVADTSSVYNKVSGYIKGNGWLSHMEKLPSRMRGNITIENNVSDEEWDGYYHKECRRYLENAVDNYKNRYSVYSNHYMGLSSSDKEFVLPEEFKYLLNECGLEYKE